MNWKPRLYLAGPSVFAPYPEEIARRLKEHCDRRFVVGVYPTDPVCGMPDAENANASQLYQRCIALLDACDGVVADIAAFRGPHMDCGTAFEIGYAVGCEKPVWLYGQTLPLIKRIWCEETEHGWRDAHGRLVEDFNLPDNLMPCIAAQTIRPTADAAIRAAADYLERKRYEQR